MMSLPHQIRAFIQKWKIASTATLRERAFSSPSVYGGLKTSLARLRQNGEILSSRIGNEVYHFHPIYRRRWEALKAQPVRSRFHYAQKWGFQHHLEVTDLGFQFQSVFPDFYVSTNVFSDFVSFAEGTTNGRGRKFCPDISLSYSKGSLSRFIYVEYEKTTKTKARYIERWLTYHADPKLRACLYITDDPNVGHRLEKLIETYLRNSVQRSAFTFGLFVQRANVKLSQETVIRELGRGISRAVKLNEFLTSQPSQSRCRPNFSNEIFSSDFTEMAGRGRLTTLSLPSSASLEVPKGTEKVVNLPLRQVELNNKDGREKFGRHRE